MLAPSLSTQGELLKFQALQTLFVGSGAWAFELRFMSTFGSYSISEQIESLSTHTTLLKF